MLDNKTSILPSSCVKKTAHVFLIWKAWTESWQYYIGTAFRSFYHIYCIAFVLNTMAKNIIKQGYTKVPAIPILRINVFASLGTLRRCCLITLLPLYSPTTLFFASTRFWYLLSSIAIDTSSPAYTRNRHVTRPSPSNKPLITVSATECIPLLHPVALVKFQRWPKARWHQLILHWKARTYCSAPTQTTSRSASAWQEGGHYFSTLPTNILVHIFWTRPGIARRSACVQLSDPNENFPRQISKVQSRIHPWMNGSPE